MAAESGGPEEAAVAYNQSRPTFRTNEAGVVEVKTDEPDTLMNLFNVGFWKPRPD